MYESITDDVVMLGVNVFRSESHDFTATFSPGSYDCSIVESGKVLHLSGVDSIHLRVILENASRKNSSLPNNLSDRFFTNKDQMIESNS